MGAGALVQRLFAGEGRAQNSHYASKGRKIPHLAISHWQNCIVRVLPPPPLKSKAYKKSCFPLLFATSKCDRG
jgi:hypothetical protein